MDGIDESGYSADSSSVSEEGSVHQTEPIVARAAEIITGNSLHSKKPSAEIRLGAGKGYILDKSKISFSTGSRSSIDSNDMVIEPHISTVQVSEPCLNDQAAQSSKINKDDQPFSVASSYEVTDIKDEPPVMSPRQSPPLQVMDRSAPYEHGRISSSVFTANDTPQEWSLASNESLFSLHVGHLGSRNGVLETGDQYGRSSDFALSDEVISNRTSMVAGQEAARSTVEMAAEQTKPSLSDKSTHDILLQKIPDLADTKAQIPETSWDPRKNTGKNQPLPTSVNKKPEKPSSCCKMGNCCFCSCASMSCCCPTSCSGCSKPKCSCCKMSSCSCSNCSVSWCCNWNCCSKKSCCSSWNGSCPEGSCCLSCNQCSKAIFCWNWSCWKLFYCWNWTCCSNGSCCRSWSCCSKGSCCKSWNCCSKGSGCKPWSCCSKGSCCGSWNCCSKGACCRSWNCCSKGACCPSWNCCSKGTCCPSLNCCSKEVCCGSWKCCSIGSCCKCWNCCSTESCSKSWNCCSTGSCCPNWNCCFKGLCSWKCGSCCKSWNCCSTGVSCCKSFKISLCCFSSSSKPRDRGVGQEMAHHQKTKTLGRTGLCGLFSCSGCSCCRR